jgi:large subunit ribosomal protein L32e
VLKMAQEIKAKLENANAAKATKPEAIKAAEKKPEVAKTTENKAAAGVKLTEKKTEAHIEKKSEAHTEKKADEKKTAEKNIEEKKAEVVKKKYIPYVKKENKAKSKEARENQKLIIKKKHTPVFRGRFGKKNIRRKSIAKWDKWRKPHGIDLDKGIQHGFRPKIGYRRSVEVRGIHPSGYNEIMVCNFNDLAKINPKTQAARLSRTLGKRKRNEIMKKANEKGVWVLN